jgi:hypothetical protein
MLVLFPEGRGLPFCRYLLGMYQVIHIDTNIHLWCIKIQKTELPVSCSFFRKSFFKSINLARNSGLLYEL